jgi:hypothetical protein
LTRKNRISLQDAAVGEEVLLLTFRHQAGASPYAASGPIFIRRSATQSFDAINVIPDQQRRRLLSVRAYDSYMGLSWRPATQAAARLARHAGRK